jgi:hypothetical protein
MRSLSRALWIFISSSLKKTADVLNTDESLPHEDIESYKAALVVSEGLKLFMIDLVCLAELLAYFSSARTSRSLNLCFQISSPCFPFLKLLELL